MKLYEPNPLNTWAQRITVIGGALVGIGSILFAIALFWDPRGGRRQRTQDRHRHVQRTEAVSEEHKAVSA